MKIINILNVLKIYLATITPFDWVLIGVVVVGVGYSCYKNFDAVKQMGLEAMKQAQIKYFGATGGERKQKAIQIFKNMKFVQKSAILKLIPPEKLYNFFEKIYQKNKEQIKAK